MRGALFSLCWMMGALAVAAGAEMPAGAVNAAVLGVSGEHAPEGLSEAHVFAGAAARLDLAVEAPLGSKVQVRADLLQVGDALAAPLSKDVALGEALDFARQTRLVFTAAIPLPKIQRLAEFRVRLKAVLGEGKAVRPMGEFRLFVYPPDQLRALRAVFLPSQGPAEASLAVFGPGKTIREFLGAQRIPFAEAGEALPRALRPGTLYLGSGAAEEAAPAIPAAGTGSVVFFTSGGLPGVYRERSGTSVVTKVSLPVLANLATNPLSQKVFSEAILQTLPSPTP